MSIAYQNNSTAVVGTDQTSITINVPTSFSAGDLLIACVAKDGYHAMTLPTGWTSIQAGATGATAYFSVSYRIAEAGDTSWTWTGISEQWVGAILRYTGQDSSTPIHASGKSAAASTTPTAPDVSYTSLLPGSLTLQCFGAKTSCVPYTTPTQLTERYSHISNESYLGSCGSAGGDKTISGTGNTGTGVFTMDGFYYWVGVTVVINAATTGSTVKPMWYYDMLRRRNQ